MNCSKHVESWLWSTWVKTPILNSSELLITSACLPVVNPALYQRLAENRVVLFACPERESPTYYGKIASMVRSMRPRKVVVVTIDGSPHCFALQAAVNEAEYILGERVEREHYVVLNGDELRRISPDAVRAARYLNLINSIIERHPETLEELREYSLEYRLSRRLQQQGKGLTP